MLTICGKMHSLLLSNRMTSQALVLLCEGLDIWELTALISLKCSTWSFQDKECWHACNLIDLLELLTLVCVDVDEDVAVLEVLRKLSHLILNLLARAAPGSGHLDERLFLSSLHNGTLESCSVLWVLKNHLYCLFV